MERHGFHTITLGCKLNRFDSAAIEGELARRGYPAAESAGAAAVVVINSCTVTHKADTEVRRLIRSVRRGNPDCVLLVTGCYAELDAATLRAMAGVDRVFGNREKPRLGAILDEIGLRGPAGGPADDGPTPTPGAVPIGGDRGCDDDAALPAAVHFGERSRAFLKVQEGCRLACSYCVIPRVRGTSRSIDPEDVERAALELVRAGYREIVLTGVNTGDYGLDLPAGDDRLDLAGLVRRLLDRCGPTRIRLNSLEPLTVSDEIVDLMATDPRLAPHLQVPLQSGSSRTLRGMRRNYRLEAYLERVRLVRERVPHAALGADVIVGFPGETDEDFGETLAFLERSPLNYLHVFSWSPRPGTPAAELPERVPAHVIRDRSARARALGDRLGLRFRQGFLGATLDAVVLGPGRDGRARALTGNFIEVSLDGPAPPPREVVGVRIVRATPRATLAEPAPPPPWSLSATVR